MSFIDRAPGDFGGVLVRCRGALVALSSFSGALRPVGVSMASDQPTSGRVTCSICGAVFTKYQTLVWHRMRKHHTTRRQPGGGLPTGAAAAGGADWAGKIIPPPPRLPPLVRLPRTQPPRPLPQAPTAPPPPPRPLGAPQGVGSHGNGGDPFTDGRDGPRPFTGLPPHATAGSDSPVSNMACDGESPPPQGSPTNGFDFEDDAVKDAIDAMDAVVKLTRRAKVPDRPARKRLRTAVGAAVATSAGWNYSCLSHDIREHYEQMKDWDAHAPLASKRKACHPGLFNSYRLRIVQRFALECGGGGMSLVDQEKFFDVLDSWDRTKPGMPVDDGHFLGLRDVFNSKTAFKNALADDIDDVIDDEGWLKCTMVEGGESFKLIFRPVLELALERMRGAKKVTLWSGGDAPAPPTTKREHPMDGDAFRLSEEAVVNDNDEDSFVVGMHAFSDASRLSGSGGMSLLMV